MSRQMRRRLLKGAVAAAASVAARHQAGRVRSSALGAVLIATGDNGHSLVSILAVKAGKDAYCEKPLSVTMAESRALADTVRRYGAVFRVGTQRRSIARFRFAVDLARTIREPWHL